MALTGEGDLSEVCKELMAEKQKAESELEVARHRLEESQTKKEEVKKKFEGYYSGLVGAGLLKI